MPSTSLSFLIKSGLLINTRSIMSLVFPCAWVGSLTCCVRPYSSRRYITLLAAVVMYPLLGPVDVRNGKIASSNTNMGVYLIT